MVQDFCQERGRQLKETPHPRDLLDQKSWWRGNATKPSSTHSGVNMPRPEVEVANLVKRNPKNLHGGRGALRVTGPSVRLTKRTQLSQLCQVAALAAVVTEAEAKQRPTILGEHRAMVVPVTAELRLGKVQRLGTA